MEEFGPASRREKAPRAVAVAVAVMVMCGRALLRKKLFVLSDFIEAMTTSRGGNTARNTPQYIVWWLILPLLAARGRRVLEQHAIECLSRFYRAFRTLTLPELIVYLVGRITSIGGI